MFGQIIIAFATIFGPPSLDPHNPNGSLACARAAVGRKQRVDAEVFAVASYKLPCGARIRVCYGDRCETARVLDRGPRRAQLTGRHVDDLDLSIGLARALGIGEVTKAKTIKTTCRDADKFRGCPVTYTVERYEPSRS